ncbi:hypothetical protein LJ737_20565 [Hymenobacter sp. 15J16-1T3B]|uniref:hypothetical protein n=1 Tax=Hymenobacter sp. 15J16-1T3B TaxID=2886941 RepID=UPI001D0FC3C8|nr:hypothetical protein [Hymenobacter sp. 15J16-1T3B]MCC3159647.1 hypothetical protein [Hymenobacter sp. 15J16-1T3B]
MSARPYSLLGLWPIVNRWKYLVLGAVSLAAVISIVVALTLPNIFKSTAVFYPTNPQTTDPDRIVIEGGKLELSGRTEDIDRVITIGNSQPVAEHIIQKFRLQQHYKIDTTGNAELAEQAALDEFSGNLTIMHSDRDAIELTFQDEDKQLAARVANTLVSVIDSFNQQLTLENRRRVLGLYRTRYDFLQSEYDRTRKALLEGRRRYGIYGLEQQSRYLGMEIIKTETALRRAEAAGNAGEVRELRRALHALTHADGGNVINLENYVQGTDSMTTLYARFNDLQSRLVGAKSAYETAELAIKGRISSLYVVQKAYPAAKKSKPIRWLIVVSSMVITFALSVVVIALLEIYRSNVGRFRTPAQAPQHA